MRGLYEKKPTLLIGWTSASGHDEIIFGGRQRSPGELDKVIFGGR